LENSIKRPVLLRAAAVFLCLLILLGTGLGETAAFLFARTSDVVNTFLSGLAPEGSLTLRKTLEHPLGEDFVLPDDLAFTFELALGKNHANRSFSAGGSTVTADQNGTVTLQVAPGGSLTVTGLPEGSFPLREVGLTDGFAVKPEPENQTTRDIAILKNEPASAVYVNVYQPAAADPSVLSLTGRKSLVGRDWEDGDTVTFTLYFRTPGESGWQTAGEDTVVCALDQNGQPTDPDFDKFDLTAALQGVPFDKSGVWAFRLSETGGMTGTGLASPRDFYFDITLTDPEMDGKLQIGGIESASSALTVSGGRIEADIQNRYADASVTVRIKKTVETSDGKTASPAGYVFALWQDGQPVSESAGTSAAGETTIVIPFSAQDAGHTFHYTVKEKDTGKDGILYDSSEYSFSVKVLADAGSIEAVVLPSGEETTTGSVGAVLRDSIDFAFVNRYQPEQASVSLAGSKTLEGRQLQAGEFTFLLYETGADFVLNEGQTPVRTAKNEADGSFTFDELTFTEAGERYFLAVEDDSAPLGGVLYDSTRHPITVRITDQGGKLSAEALCITDAVREADIRFANRYKASPFKIDLAGKKELNGRELAAGEFSFLLKDERGETVFTVKNDENGNIFFPTLSISETGEYLFTVCEDRSQPVENIRFDETVYTLSVTVTDDQKGQLTADSVALSADGETVDRILFVNEFVPEEESSKPDTPILPDQPEEPDEPERPDGDDEEKESPDTSDRNDRAVSLAVMLFGILGFAVTAAVYIRRKWNQGAHR